MADSMNVYIENKTSKSDKERLHQMETRDHQIVRLHFTDV